MQNWESGWIHSLRLLCTPYCKLQVNYHPKVMGETKMSMCLSKGGSMLLRVLVGFFLSVSFWLLLAKNVTILSEGFRNANLLLIVQNNSAFYWINYTLLCEDNFWLLHQRYDKTKLLGGTNGFLYYKYILYL